MIEIDGGGAEQSEHRFSMKVNWSSITLDSLRVGFGTRCRLGNVEVEQATSAAISAPIISEKHTLIGQSVWRNLHGANIRGN